MTGKMTCGLERAKESLGFTKWQLRWGVTPLGSVVTPLGSDPVFCLRGDVVCRLAWCHLGIRDRT